MIKVKSILVALLIISQWISTQQSFAKKQKIILTSTAFENKGGLPEKYTCDGENISPPLRWDNLPEKTKSISIIMEDLDSPKIKFTHWVIFNISPLTSELLENLPEGETLENEAIFGSNDFRQVGYDGPCPPSGSPHKYAFKIFALKKELNLQEGATKKQLLREMRRKILAKEQLIGIYER